MSNRIELVKGYLEVEEIKQTAEGARFVESSLFGGMHKSVLMPFNDEDVKWRLSQRLFPTAIPAAEILGTKRVLAMLIEESRETIRRISKEICVTKNSSGSSEDL